MNRKQAIADTALRLFAERGYEHTPTQLIAREAGVSEALIFKHFGNKEQLLAHIIKSGYKRIVEHNPGMLQQDDPIRLIHSILDLPARLVAQEPEFWKLQYRLVDMPLSNKHHTLFLQPVYTLLMRAFETLGYEDPEAETQFVLLVIDALWKKQVMGGIEATAALPELIKKKYSPH
jgi:AcrR family transcriptional regulator